MKMPQTIHYAVIKCLDLNDFFVVPSTDIADFGSMRPLLLRGKIPSDFKVFNRIKVRVNGSSHLCELLNINGKAIFCGNSHFH